MNPTEAKTLQNLRDMTEGMFNGEHPTTIHMKKTLVDAHTLIEQLQAEVEQLRDRDVNDEAYTSNLEAEVERLKGGIEKWLREGVNKYDTCPHGKMWYEGCEACDESYFAALIAPQEQSNE